MSDLEEVASHSEDDDEILDDETEDELEKNKTKSSQKEENKGKRKRVMSKRKRKAKKGKLADGKEDEGSSSSSTDVQDLDIDSDEEQDMDRIDNLNRAYQDLIEKTKKIELKTQNSYDKNLPSILDKNFKKGTKLFEQLTVAPAPSDMCSAFEHMTICSRILRIQTQNIGMADSPFKLVEFLQAIKSRAVAMDQDSLAYSADKAMTILAAESSYTSYTVPTLQAVVGTFDREAISGPTPVKEKRVRQSIRRKDTDEGEATQHEEVNLTQEKHIKDHGDATASKKLMQELKDYFHNQPGNMFQFAVHSRVSTEHVIEKIFGLSVSAYEGAVSLSPGVNGDCSLSKLQLDMGLNVTPSEKPEGRIESHSHIVSFSPMLLKKFTEALKQK